MKCFTCLHYLTEACIEEQFRPSFAKAMLDELDELGFDGYCSNLDVYIFEECCCSNHTQLEDY